MHSGGREKSSENPTRTLQAATIIGLVLAGVAIGMAYVGDARAVDEPKQVPKVLKKNAPPAKGKPTAPIQKPQLPTVQKQQLPAVQKQSIVNPEIGRASCRERVENWDVTR